VQQNAGAAEEMTSTSEELASQADQLQTTISFFRIDGLDRAVLAAPDRKSERREIQSPQIARVAYHQRSDERRRVRG